MDSGPVSTFQVHEYLRPKVPTQPDLKQCGFFVLRYMRCIFEFEGSVDMDSMLSLFKKKTYSRDQIDEMLVEWTECIQCEI
ncbi:hypothetical protein ACS0TY_016581 [Phlomoides rotata]